MMDAKKQYSSFIDLLNDEVQDHHVEFFVKGRESGFVNHVPLTLIGACLLGANASDLSNFVASYEAMLAKFSGNLVSPIYVDAKLDTKLPVKQTIENCLNNPVYSAQLRDYFINYIEHQGIDNVINEVLAMATRKGSFYGKLFHAFLLSAFPLQLQKLVKENGELHKRTRPAIHYLIASGLSMMFTIENDRVQFGPLFNISAKSAKVPSVNEIARNINNVRNSYSWNTLFCDMAKSVGKPLFLFGLNPYAMYGVEDDQKRFENLFNEYLDFSLCMIQENSEQLVCALGEYILQYYTTAHGFVALHIVSCMCALVILADFMHTEQFCEVFRHVWRLMSYVILLIETAAEKEGVSQVERARGDRNEPIEPSEWISVDKDWETIIKDVTQTDCSHSIKLCFAAKTISAFIDSHSSDSQNIDRIAKQCSVIATLYRIR